MYEEAATHCPSRPPSLPYSPDYRSVVMNKGAMIFHMVPRRKWATFAFKSLLHDFYNKYAEGSATIENFEALAEAARTSLRQGRSASSGAAAASSLNGSIRPAFRTSPWSTSFTVRTKVFRAVGKIKQPLDTFHMPVDLRIDTEGNPENKTVDVVGTESEFTVETFRPPPSPAESRSILTTSS